MNGKDLQGLNEAYSQVHQSPELLNELDSAFIGGRIGQGRRALRVGGSAGGFGGEFEFGTAKAKDTAAAGSAETTNAIANVKNAQRDADIASRNAATAAAKPTARPAIKPGATGAAALGGGLSLSSSEKNAVDANRAPLPTTAAKVSVPQARNVAYARGNVSGSAALTPQRPVQQPTSTTPSTPQRPKTDPNKDPRGAKPLDSKPPMDRKGADFKPMDRKGEDFKPMDRKGEDFKKPEQFRKEQFAYYQLLTYLIDEGYASTEESADKIILNMSESWFEEIMEARRSEKEGKGSPEYRTASGHLVGQRGEKKRKGEMGGRHFWSGGQGGSNMERGKKKVKGAKGDENKYTQHGRNDVFQSRTEKSGKYSSMQARKRGSEMGSRFD